MQDDRNPVDVSTSLMAGQNAQHSLRPPYLSLLAAIVSTTFLGPPTLAAEVINLRSAQNIDSRLRSLSPVPPPALSAAASTPGARTPEIAEIERTFSSALGLQGNDRLQLESSKQTRQGITHYHFTQLYDDIPVWGSRITVSKKPDNSASRASGQLLTGLAADLQSTEARLQPNDVIQIAKEAIERQAEISNPPIQGEAARQVIYNNPGTGQAHLAYEVTFFTILDSEGHEPARPVFIIDANSGETLLFYNDLKHADPKGIGPGGNIRTGQYEYGTGGLQAYLVEESDSTCTMRTDDVETEDLKHSMFGSGKAYSFQCFSNRHEEINGAFAPLNDAHAFGQVVFDMYNKWYGERPLEDQLFLRVHYSRNYGNAFWDPQTKTMSFGDGNARFYPLVSLDVLAHEVSHGFTEQNSGLIYRNQSGGINEAFSDMAGEAAELFLSQEMGVNFGHDMPDFQTGADIFKAPGKALRYLSNPTLDGLSIDSAGNYVDGMDVHFSSGVFNKAFYVLATSAEWDTRKAFEVFLVANRDYWAPTSTFETAAIAAVDAARDLGYPTTDVVKAFSAVDIHVPPAMF